MKTFSFNPADYYFELKNIIFELLELESFSEKELGKIVKKYPKDKSEVFRKDQIIAGIKMLQEKSEISSEDADILINAVKLKPTRTESGVTTVTVLTKPFACPGQCIFCPNDVRMPKSYIATEPGAQRALMNRFSGYFQVYNRLKALKNIGHPVSKIELLILGGTWSYYPKAYQISFIYDCFKAMNDFGAEVNVEFNPGIDISKDLAKDFNEELRSQTGDKPYNQLIQTKEFKEGFEKKFVEEPKEVSWKDLEKEQEINSHGKVRCVGLVLETRPDAIDEREVFDLRKLGATKIQIGIQTLDDKVSDLNKRGEHKIDVIKAFKLLRAGGFKIHGHIMPNLYGATPVSDLKVYKELFENIDFKPDELKIYPTSIIKNTPLFSLWKEGKYQPYTPNELIEVLTGCMSTTPEYCRLTRIIRDIPSTEIEGGNKTTNLREVVEYNLKKQNLPNKNIRAREIKSKKISEKDLFLDEVEYKTNGSKEFFLQYINEHREIAGFLRLSLPESKTNPITSELNNCAIIREVHVYGPSIAVSKESEGNAQHLGLGTKLIERAKELAIKNGFNKLAVISSIGTREYYKKRGFKLGEMYQVWETSDLGHKTNEILMEF